MIECKHCDRVFVTKWQWEDHLMKALHDHGIVIRALSKAVLELDATAFCPPSEETQRMIGIARKLLK